MGRWVGVCAHRRHPVLHSLLASGLLMACIGCASSRSVSLTVPLIPSFPLGSPPVFLTESFDALDPGRWRNVEVEGRTQYDVVSLDGRSCLKAQSQAGASILLTEARFDPEQYEWLSWQWRVDQLIEGEDLNTKDGSDASARVYVYFDTGGLPWQKRNLDYVWSASLPVGTVLTSAYSETSKIIVVESGATHLGRWRTVERNLEDDYELVFGKAKKLPKVAAIGIMTDTDNTKASGLAYFDDLKITTEQPSRKRR